MEKESNRMFSTNRYIRSKKGRAAISLRITVEKILDSDAPEGTVEVTYIPVFLWPGKDQFSRKAAKELFDFYAESPGRTFSFQTNTTKFLTGQVVTDLIEQINKRCALERNFPPEFKWAKPLLKRYLEEVQKNDSTVQVSQDLILDAKKIGETIFGNSL